MKLTVPRVVVNWKSSSMFSMPAGRFVLNGHGRQYLPHDDAPFRVEAFDAFGLQRLFPEPQFRNFVGRHHLDGAHTHLHQDPEPDGYVHVRCNWMLTKPPVGGDPIIDDETVPVNEGDLWLCIASRERHASTPVRGGERVICSFGALVPKADAESLIDGGSCERERNDFQDGGAIDVA